MKVAVVGNGNVGGGLADRWERAGHDVTRIGREGGDVSEADVVLIAVPAPAVPSMFGTVRGFAGKTVIDATNLMGDAPDGFGSNTEFIKSKTGGPTAMSFSINFASLYDRLDEPGKRPGNIWCGDEEARDAVEELTRDAGYQPLYAGGIEKARAREAFLTLLTGISEGGMGPYFYRMAPPNQL